MNTILQDLRFALRQLLRSPGFTVTAILTLALGIGATTAIFTLVYQVILRSIPVSHPEQLFKVGKELECCVDSGLQRDWRIFSYDLYRSLRDQTPGIEGMAAVQAGRTTVSARRAGENSEAEAIQARFVSGNYFPLLGVNVSEGRLLGIADDQENAPPAAVISYALWQTKFAGKPGLVGSTLLLSGHPVTLVGITAREFLGERNEQSQVGLWMPLSQEPVFESDRQLVKFPDEHWLDVLVRIKDPHQAPKVELAIQGELRQWLMSRRDLFPRATDKDLSAQTTELASASGGINDLRDQYEKSLKLLLLVAGFVLLIACANLANLMLVRGMARQQELAVRSALGAPRRRLVRQMLVEAILLSLCGGVAALGVAYAGARGILALTLKGSAITPLTAAPSLPVLGFAFAVSLVTGVVFGITPAWITSRSRPIDALRGSQRSTRDASAMPQKILVIFQAALSLVLLSAAGLLISSLRQLEHQNFHFDPQGRLVLFLDLPAAGYHYEQLAGLYQHFDDTFSHLPGVESFGYGTYSPMTQNNYSTGLFFPGVVQQGYESPNASYSLVSPGFMETVGTKVLLGRGINEQDTATSVHVAVVNQTFVHRLLKDKQAIGQHFGTSAEKAHELEIVGVVDDTKYRNPTRPVAPMFFTPIRQATVYTKARQIQSEQFDHLATNLIVHYRGEPGSMAATVRQALKSIDPGIPILRMTTYEDQLSTNFTQEDLVVRLTTLFGLLALVLASIGLYGVTAYTVARRTTEIGIRMALGADRGNVLTMILRSAVTQAAIGLAIGLPLTYAAGRMLQASLYQTSAFQPVVLFAVCALLFAATFAAAAIPSYRAASIDPMRALRAD